MVNCTKTHEVVFAKSPPRPRARCVSGKIYLAGLNLLADAAFNFFQGTGGGLDPAHNALQLLQGTESNTPFGYDALQLGGSDAGKQRDTLLFLDEVVKANILQPFPLGQREDFEVHRSEFKGEEKKKVAPLYRVREDRAQRYAPLLELIHGETEKNMAHSFLFPKDSPSPLSAARRRVHAAKKSSAAAKSEGARTWNNPAAVAAPAGGFFHALRFGLGKVYRSTIGRVLGGPTTDDFVAAEQTAEPLLKKWTQKGVVLWGGHVPATQVPAWHWKEALMSVRSGRGQRG